MKANKLITAGIITVLIVAVCYGFTGHTIKGEGEVEKRNYSVSSFDKIELCFGADVYYEQKSDTKVTVETNQNLFEYIKVRVDDNKLYLDTKKNACLKTTDGINIYVSSPDLAGLCINGSGTIHLDEAVKTADLNCEIDGSGSIIASNISSAKTEFEINGSGDIIVEKWNGSEYDIEIDGSGDVRISSGEAQKGTIEINGSGEVLVDGVKCQNAEVEIAGSGDVQVHASQNLSVEVAGSGDVTYKGNPKVSTDIAGSGDVNQMK